VFVTRLTASVNETAYSWDLRTDGMSWASNMAAVLSVQDTRALDSGRGYDMLVDSEHIAKGRREGEGTPFHSRAKKTTRTAPADMVPLSTG
jgi:hypothetical protein